MKDAIAGLPTTSGSGPQEFDGRKVAEGQGIPESQHTLDVAKPPKLMIRFGGNQG